MITFFSKTHTIFFFFFIFFLIFSLTKVIMTSSLRSLLTTINAFRLLICASIFHMIFLSVLTLCFSVFFSETITVSHTLLFEILFILE